MEVFRERAKRLVQTGETSGEGNRYHSFCQNECGFLLQLKKKQEG